MVSSPSDAWPSTTDAIERCYESCRYYTAYLGAKRIGLFDVDDSTPPERALLAGRLLRANGAPRRARKLILETWRRFRRHPGATVRAIYEIAAEEPFAGLEWIERLGEPSDGTDEDRSDWMAARAICLLQLRDFLGAQRALDAARERYVDAWTWCVRAMIDDARDRSDDALAALAQARSLSPWYRPAVELEARVLVRARRADDARALLASAVAHIESASTCQILSILQREAGAIDDAVATVFRSVMLSPVMERELHDFVAHSLAYLHYLRGDIGLSVRLLRLIDSDVARSLAQRIETTPGTRRRLPVPHIPQHHQTCAPATLTAIATMWGEEVDHAELAEAICHDGTPAGNERKWADERGFVTRQLTVTWDSARGLVDAGVPIALTTSFTIGAHLQPVAGYDERRRTLLVTEPGAAGLVELDWDALVKSQAAFGPRGMVFVPAARAALLDGLALPDAALYDHHYAIEMALQRHDRVAAQAAYDALVAAAPQDHYLRYHATRALASYDGDERGTLAWVSGLRAHHPDDLFLTICELSSLHGHASDERRAEITRELLANHRKDPGAVLACGRFLLGIGDAVRAWACASRAMRMAPAHASGYHLAADLAWIAGDRTRATQLYRFASCLAEGNEGLAWSYFAAGLITGSVDEALEHLRDRVARMRARSAGPAQTLCDAYRAVGRAADGIALLDDAIALHSDDGMLLLIAAEQHRISGDLARATTRLAEAQGKVSDLVWRRASAVHALHRGDVDAALELRRKLVEEDPLDVASQHAYVSLLQRTGAADTARAHIVAACERFPFHIPLAQLCDQVLRQQDPAAARSHLEAFLERQPRSAWALHQLAELLVQRGDLAGARALLVRARACTDDVAATKVAEAALEAREGRRDAAMDLLRAAIEIDVDTPGGVTNLLALARDGAEARGLLDAIGGELSRQGSSGPGLITYSAGLRDWLDPLTALERLHAIRVARPHQWHAWSAEIDALIGAGRLDQAREVATTATERYGHSPRAWYQLAAVEGERGDRAAQIHALERAVELDPRTAEPMRALAEAYIASEDLQRAREVIERAIAEEPLAETNYGYLARIANLDGDNETARKHLERAIELEPEYTWAWHCLLEWSADERSAFAKARAAVKHNRAAIAPRLLLTRFAPDLSIDERVVLFDEAIRSAPDRVDVHDAKAVLLAGHERWDEALAACRPAFWGDAPPSTLLGRAAWIRYARGEKEAAISDMLAAIRKTPSYVWAIEQLLTWGTEVGAPLRTAERLVEAAPDTAFAHAVLGEAQREARDFEAAELSFARALQIDGTHQLARLGLFDVCYAQRKYDRAEPLLDALPDTEPYVMAKRVQILAVTGRLDEADVVLARMLRRGVADPSPIDEAVSGYRDAGAHARVEALLDRLLEEPDAPHAVARAWWNHVGQHRGRFRRWRQIRALPASDAGSLVAAFHVEEYGERTDFIGLLGFLVLNYRIARARTDVWGSIGFCLLRTGHRLLMRWWMRDYARRDGVEPWMLNNLARMLIVEGRVARAAGVCRRALELAPDHATHSVRLMLAPIEALSNDEAASRALSAARRRPWSEEERFCGELTEALILYRRSARDVAARDELAAACEQMWRRQAARASSLCHQLYEYVMIQISRTLGSQKWNWLLEMRRYKPAADLPRIK